MFIWFIWGRLLLALGCMVCSMEKHQQALFSVSLSQFNIFALRGIGCLELLLSLLMCIKHFDLSVGITTYLGSVTLAGLIVMFILSYQAQRFIAVIFVMSMFCIYLATFAS